MANIKKSFNFRNGVQVDDDNFIINPNGLVGIGSTIPTESLDVQGNIRLRGTLYADDIETGSITNTSDTGAATFILVNVGITSVKSGIISASSGIVTYYGDGSNLQGLPTSQWIDVDPSLLGYTSIYAAGNVGVATTNPIYSFQVGGNFSIPSFENGVGISSDGDIKATRDITIGRNINIGGICTIGSNLVVSGSSNIGSNLVVSGSSNIGSNLVVSGSSNIGSNLSVTGITTSYSFSGFGTNITGINASNISNGTLNNDRLPTNINKPTGIATFNVFNGSLVGIATTARGLTNDANIDIISIVSDRSDLGIATANTLDVTTSIGIGTEIPNSDVHLRKTSDATLEVTSDTNAARIIIGREVDDGVSNSFAFLRFGNDDISQNIESTEESFDIVNYAPGNLNYYIRPESTENLKFNWINYSTNTILASLTASGKLGIGKTNPTETFEVVGTSTVTSTSYFGSDVYISGSLYPNSLTVSGNSLFNSLVGIKTSNPLYDFQVGNNPLITNGLSISASGNLYSSGILTASSFSGNGSNLTSISPENISTGTISNVDINTTGIITASSFSGNGSNLTSISPENISTGTISNVDINTTGIITASSFSGNGSNLTSISPENISTGTISNVDINTTGIITASSFDGSISADNITAGNINSNININSTAGIITALLVDAFIYPINILDGNVETNITFDNAIGIGTTVPRDSLQIQSSTVYSGIGTEAVVAGVSTYIDSFPSDLYCSAEYLIHLNLNSNIQTQKIVVMNDSSSAFSTEHSILYNPNKIVDFSFSFDSVDSEIRLNILPQSGMNGILTYRFIRTSILTWDPFQPSLE